MPTLPYGSTLKDAKVQQAMQGLAEVSQGMGAPWLATVKNGLNGGELAPDMLARYDLPRYQMGCEEMVNMIPLTGGGVSRRPGFQFVSGTGGHATRQARLLPFVYSASLSMMLMILANEGGGQVYILDRDGAAEAVASCRVPYTDSEINDVCFCQCGKIVYCAHANHPPAKLVFDGQGFSYERISFSNKTPIPKISNSWFLGEWLNVYNQTRWWVATAINPDTGEESLPSPVSSNLSPPLNSQAMVELTIDPLPGVKEYRIYKKRGGVFGYIGTARDRGDGELKFRDDGITPDTLDQPPEEFEGLANKGDYPSIVFLHQQRLGWASSDNGPLTIWMSQTSAFESMQAKKPPRDDDAIEATLASSQANRILWAVSDRSGLAIGTEGEEWYMTGASGQAAVTPNSISFQPQSRYGSAPGIGPARANASLLFAQRGGKIVRDLGYSYAADRYEAQDLTLLARHMFRDDPIVCFAWQGSPYNILWCVKKSGDMAGLTYMPEQEIMAWHRHETDGRVLSCAALDDSQGVSRLWIIARRHGVEYVEIMRREYNGVDDPAIEGAGKSRHVDGLGEWPYESRLIPCLPESGMENGSSFLRVKKINAVKALVINSQPFKCRVISRNAEPTGYMPMPARTASANRRLGKLEYADMAAWDCPIGAGFRDGSKLQILIDGQGPATILGLAITMEVAARTGGQI